MYYLVIAGEDILILDKYSNKEEKGNIIKIIREQPDDGFWSKRVNSGENCIYCCNECVKDKDRSLNKLKERMYIHLL